MREEDGEEVVARLAAIGLEDRAAKLYVDLLRHGPSRASDAAARVRLKRTETYRALESLMKDGFVAARLTRPVEYEASPPEAVFADLLARHEQRRAEMEALRERVATMVAQREDGDGGEARHGYRIIQGRRAILSAAESLHRAARERIALASALFTPAIVTPGNRSLQTLRQRASDGVLIELLVREHPEFERAFASLIEHRNVRTRFLDLPPGVRLLLIDDKEVLVWLVSDATQGIDARDDVAMWTNAHDFVQAQRALFDALWPQGREGIRLSA